MARKIGAVIALDGEQQFKSAVSACTKSLNTMKSALKLAETQAAGQKKSLESMQKAHEALNKVLEAARNKEKAVQDGLDHAKRDYENVGKQVDEYRQKLDKAQKELDEMKKSGDATDDELKEQERVVKSLSEAVEQGEKAYDKAGSRVRDWEKKLYDAKTETAKVENAVEESTSALEDMEKATDGAGDELSEFAEEADNAEGKTGELEIGLKSMVKAAAVDMAVGAMKTLAEKAGEAAKYVVEVGSEFEASMSKVKAISGATGGEMDQLTAKAKELGASTKFSASEVGSAFQYMGMAGWKTRDMLSGIDGILSLAAASGEDLATTSDIVTDALTAFGKSAEDAGKLADIMAAASSNANTNVSMMGETFKFAAPVAGALGISMEDTALAVGLMANAGIKASQAGTAIRTGLSNLVKPSKQAADAMEKYGIEIRKNSDGSINLRATMEHLRSKFGELSETEQAAAASAIFGKNAMSGWLAIVNGSDEDFNKLANAIDNSNGAAKDMSDIMQDNLQGKITEFKSALEGLGIALYNKVAEPLTGAVSFATGVLSDLTKALTTHKSENQEAIDQIKQANDEMQTSLENSKSVLENAEIDAAKVGILGQALIDLNTQEELSAAQKEALKGVYDQLVEVVPDLAGYYNEETGKVDLTREAIEKLIKVREEEIIEQGRLKATTELLDAMGEAQARLDLALSRTEGMKRQKQMWYDLQEMVGNATEEYRELANTFQGERIDNEWSKDFQKQWSDIAQEALGSGAITMTQYEEIERMFTQPMSESTLINMFDLLGQNAENTQGQIDSMNEEVEEATKIAGEAQQQYDLYAQQIAETAEAHDNEAAAARDSATSIGDMRDEQNALRKSLGETADRTEIVNEKLEEYRKGANESAEATGEAADKTYDLNTALNGLEEGFEDTGEAADEEAQQIEDATQKVRDHHQALKTIRDTITEYRDSVVEAFGDAKEAASQAFDINPFSEWGKNAENGIAKFRESMQSQIDGMLAYKDNLGLIRDNLGEISPEFVGYLEDMGVEGAMLVEELANAFRNGDASTAQELIAMYTQALDGQEDIANMIGLDKMALMLGLNDMASSVAEWEDLGYAFDTAVGVIQAKGEQMTAETSNAFWAAVDTAKAMGVQIPAGLAESIRTSEDPELAVQEATDQLTGAMWGRTEGVLASAQQAGLAVPEGLAQSIREHSGDPEAAYNELVGLLGGKQVDFETVGSEAGAAMGGSTAAGIGEKQEDVTGAADTVISAAKETATTSGGLFRMVGKSTMEMLKSGFLDKKDTVKEGAVSVVSGANEAAKLYGERVFEASGKSMGEKLASGIGSTQSAISEKLVSMVSEANTKSTEMVSAISQACSEMSRIVSSTYLRFPNIQIPHVRWTWDTIYYGDGAWTQVPNFYVDWFAKAMEKGMILDNPTIFGAMNGKLLGAGEAGSETVVGTDSLMNMIENAVRETTMQEAAYDDVGRKLDSLINAIGQYMPQIINGMSEDKVFDADGSYMGRFRKKLSSEIAMDVRRARA